MLNELLKGDYIDLYLIPWSIKIITALLIFVIGRWVARLLVKMSGSFLSLKKLLKQQVFNKPRSASSFSRGQEVVLDHHPE